MVVKTISPKAINKQLNKCYMEYDPEWPHNFQEERVYNFKYYMELKAGLKLDFVPKIDPPTLKYRYEIQQIEVVDEPKYLMWFLRWS